MSKFVLLLAAPLVLGMAAFSQESSPPPATSAPRPKHHAAQRDRAEMRLRRISKRLNLTDDQKEKLRPILQDESKRMKEVDDDTALTAQDKHKKLKEIHRATRLQMDEILTDDQKKLLPPERPRGTGAHGRRHGQPNTTTSTPAATSSQ